MQGHAYTATAVRPRQLAKGSRWSSAQGALAVCGLCLLAMAAVWCVAELVPAVQLKDAVLLDHLTRLDKGSVDWLAGHLVHLLEPSLFILWAIALVSFALARERPRTALAITVVMALAPFTAETLKPLLAHPHVSAGSVFIGPASWPSGHATAATALALSAVLVVPPRLRPVTAVLALLFIAGVGISLLILAWHMPSDVLGGCLLGSFWAALAVAVLRAADRRWPPARRRSAG
jgi:membrane-associated phospholipid phosphatase